MVDASNKFGGDHTEEKLRRVADYLKAYTTALKSKKYRLLYIDAFAGTGYRQSPSAGVGDDTQDGMFSGASVGDSEHVKELMKGSARLALEARPTFDEYFLIEANRHRWRALCELRNDFPDMRDRIHCVHGDANIELPRICAETHWAEVTRAVVFLDPYGAQVDWATLESIAATEAVDLWYLFPLMAVVRMTPRRGTVPDAWARRLDQMLGETAWRDAFYQEERERDLFGERDIKKSTSPERVERYLLGRLKQIFPGVAMKALRLPEEEGRAMFLLVFACSNPSPRARGLALRIANHILTRPSNVRRRQ